MEKEILRILVNYSTAKTDLFDAKEQILALLDVSQAKRTVKRGDNATAYNDGYVKGYEDALIDRQSNVL